MRRNTAVMAGLLAGVLCAGTAWAQMGRGMGFPRFFGDWNAKVGAGSVYLIENQGQEKSTRMEVAVVGEEKVDGQTAYWLEMTLDGGGRPGGGAITRMLFAKQGDEVSVKRTILKMGPRPPMEMPMQMMMVGGNVIQKETFNWKHKAKHLGSATVSTPAGAFPCEHYQTGEGGDTVDVWVSSKVAPFGVVKTQGPKSSMVLQKVLTDQKTKITEPVQKMDMPMGPRQ